MKFGQQEANNFYNSLGSELMGMIREIYAEYRWDQAHHTTDCATEAMPAVKKSFKRAERLGLDMRSSSSLRDAE